MPPKTITDILHEDEETVKKFRRALRERHQIVFDDLWIGAYEHRSAALYSGHLLPFESFLMGMLVKEHEEVMQLRELPRIVTRLRGEVEFVRRELKELQQQLKKQSKKRLSE
jgi:hypothetical protein